MIVDTFSLLLAFTALLGEVPARAAPLRNDSFRQAIDPSPITGGNQAWQKRDIEVFGSEECMLATDQQVQSMSGYEAALDRVKIDFGGRRPIKAYANDDRWPQYKLYMCRSRNPVISTFVPGSKTCQQYEDITQRDFQGVSGTLAVTTSITHFEQTSTTVTTSTTQEYGWSVGASLEFKGVGGISGDYSKSSSTLNSTSNSYTTFDSYTAMHTTSIPAKPNQICSISTSTRTCSAEYLGVSRNYLKGYVHYQFDRAVVNLGGSKADKHQTWMRDTGRDWTVDGASKNTGLKTLVSGNGDTVGTGTCRDR